MTDQPRVTADDFNDIPTSSEADKPRHSWTPNSLIQLAQNPPAPPTIGGILYPGKRTLLSGETESLKTWLALILAKAEMNIEQTVAWVDLDDMGAGAILHRLRALHIPDQTIHDHFQYYQPDQRLKDQALTDVVMRLTVTGVRLMVIDAFTPALALHGLDPGNSIDIETFWREIADPIAQTGACPCVLDHVVKNADQRGKYATGSERKASGATVHIGARQLVPFGIGRTGSSLLTTHKDRPGYLPRPTIAILELASDGENVTHQFLPDHSHDGGTFRPTILMERISQTLETTDEPVSQTWIEANVSGNTKAKRAALQHLTEGGYLNLTAGPRNTRLYTSHNPYREAADIPFNDPALTPTNPAQKTGQFGTSTTPTPPFPLQKGGVVAVTTPPKTEWATPTPTNGNEPDLTPLDLLLDSEPEPEENA